MAVKKTESRKTAARSATKATAKATKKASASGVQHSAQPAAKKTAAKRSGAWAHPLTDHEEIRQWAEDRGAVPSCVRGTGDGQDAGTIRLDFPGYGGEESLDEISWDEWFDKFDENALALMVQDTTAGGGPSNFNQLVKRTGETARRKPKTRAAG
jgi:hypothetical protein